MVTLLQQALNATTGASVIPSAAMPSSAFQGKEFYMFVQTVRTTVGEEEGSLPLRAVAVTPEGQQKPKLTLRWRLLTAATHADPATVSRGREDSGGDNDAVRAERALPAWADVPMVAAGGAQRSVFTASISPLPLAGTDLEWFVTAQWQVMASGGESSGKKKLVFPPEAGEAAHPQYATVLVLPKANTGA